MALKSINQIIQTISTKRRAMKSRKREQMDFIQRITLTPFEKYTHYGIFPWKFLFHLLLVAFCTYQALKIVSIQDKHTRIQQNVFSNIYLQNSDGKNSLTYYSLTDFTQTFFDIFDQTDLLNQTLLQYSDINNVLYRLEVYYSEMDLAQDRKIIFEGNQTQFLEKLQEIPLTEDNTVEMKQFIQQVEAMYLEISNVITYLSMDDKGKMNECLNWTVQIQYSFQSFSNVQSSLNVLSKTCQIDGEQSEKQSIFFIHFFVIAFSICSLFTSWTQVYDTSKEYMLYKKQLKNQLQQTKLRTTLDWKKSWDQLDFFDKMKFFDFWFIISVAGNFLQLFGALVGFLDEIIKTNLVIFQHKQLLIGFGVMLAWIAMLQYLQFNNNLNVMTGTLSKSWNNLIMFLLGVMPFFIGFIFLGQTIFWKYNKFESSSSSTITLFSLLNGDIVNDTFLQTWAEGLAGQIYLIFFMILFYTAVQNIFVTIIMQGYEENLKQKQYKGAIEQDLDSQKQAKYENLIKISQEESSSIIINYSPQMSIKQQISYSKLMMNGRRIDKILKQVSLLKQELEKSQLTPGERKYVDSIMKEGLQSISHSLQLQLNKMNTNSIN